MINEIYNNLLNNIETRKNLIALKEFIKDTDQKEAFLDIIHYDVNFLRAFLSNEDAKVRKNIALIIGELELEGLAIDLVETYVAEETMFVKTAYLKALQKLPCEPYISILSERLKELMESQHEETKQKHVSEEIRELTKLINQYENSEGHVFIGYEEPSKVILTTNRMHSDVTFKQLKGLSCKKMVGGVSVVSDDLREVLDVRTYSEVLFTLPSAKNMELDPQMMAHTIMMSGLMQFLDARHFGSGSYGFRVEIRGKLDVDRKRDLVKKIGFELEKASNHQLINAPSDYEIELRFIESKSGNYHAYLKLYTIEDDRFAYREKALAYSINPVTAATIMELARPYLKEGAQVLDPFCGTGTMLIERSIAMEAHPLYGVDIYGTAIDYARVNTDRAGMIINYINRDFAQFSHEYHFDEIVTNMPCVMGVKEAREIESIYAMFFEKLPEHLKDNGIIVMYSADPGIANKQIKLRSDIEVLEKFQIYQKDETYLYILKHHK